MPLSTFTHFESGTAPLSINRQGQFPVVTISFNLAPDASLGEATTAIEQAQKDLDMPASIQAIISGHGPGFQSFVDERAAAYSGSDDYCLHRARRSLRKLHSSAHDSLNAALGRGGSDSGAVALPLGTDAWSRSSASSC